MGSWAVTATPNFAVSAGFIGLVMMSISNGLPIIMVAQLGHRVVKIMPDAMRCVCMCVCVCVGVRVRVHLRTIVGKDVECVHVSVHIVQIGGAHQPLPPPLR